MSRLPISANLKVMGVVNTTPDSFSDGGQFDTLDDFPSCLSPLYPGRNDHQFTVP